MEFLQRAFRRAGITNPVHTVDNGEAAIAYLKAEGPFADRTAFPFPSILITDLKMPQMGGLELLQWLQTHDIFRGLPAIVFTSSTSQADVNAAFACGAAGYMIKPVSLDELERIVKTIGEYWRLSRVPSVMGL